MKINYKDLLKPLASAKNAMVLDLKTFLDTTDFTSDKIIIFATDHMSITEDIYLPPEQRGKSTFDCIIDVTNQHPNKSFLLIHNCLNTPTKIKNLKSVFWAHEWLTNSANDYRELTDIKDKSFKKNKIWISLNNNRRLHRYMVAMYMLGNDFENSGFLTLSPSLLREHESWESFLYWWHYNDHQEIDDIKEFHQILKRGFDKIINGQGFTLREYDVKPFLIRMQDNFDHNLRPWYRDSLIEIITESIWQPDLAGIITEKFFNSVYARNFPILIGVKNSVKKLRELNLDLFDDVIDHSYDSISSPTLRLITALDSNKKLFTDFDFVKNNWLECQDRMEKNLQICHSLENNVDEIFLNTIGPELELL